METPDNQNRKDQIKEKISIVRTIWTVITFAATGYAVYLNRLFVDKYTGQLFPPLEIFLIICVILLSFSISPIILQHVSTKVEQGTEHSPVLSSGIKWAQKHNRLTAIIVAFCIYVIVFFVMFPSEKAVVAADWAPVVSLINKHIEKNGKAPESIAGILNEFQESVEENNSFRVRVVSFERKKIRRIEYFFKDDVFVLGYDVCFAMFAVSYHYCYTSTGKSWQAFAYPDECATSKVPRGKTLMNGAVYMLGVDKAAFSGKKNEGPKLKVTVSGRKPTCACCPL